VAVNVELVGNRFQDIALFPVPNFDLLLDLVAFLAQVYY
jgi:hypothetical protein